MTIRPAIAALILAFAALPASAMVEYTQMATDAAEAAGCAVTWINERGQVDGELVYDVECAPGSKVAGGEVVCTPDACVFVPKAGKKG